MQTDIKMVYLAFKKILRSIIVSSKDINISNLLIQTAV